MGKKNNKHKQDSPPAAETKEEVAPVEEKQQQQQRENLKRKSSIKQLPAKEESGPSKCDGCKQENNSLEQDKGDRNWYCRKCWAKYDNQKGDGASKEAANSEKLEREAGKGAVKKEKAQSPRGEENRQGKQSVERQVSRTEYVEEEARCDGCQKISIKLEQDKGDRRWYCRRCWANFQKETEQQSDAKSLERQPSQSKLEGKASKARTGGELRVDSPQATHLSMGELRQQPENLKRKSSIQPLPVKEESGPSKCDGCKQENNSLEQDKGDRNWYCRKCWAKYDNQKGDGASKEAANSEKLEREASRGAVKSEKAQSPRGENDQKPALERKASTKKQKQKKATAETAEEFFPIAAGKENQKKSNNKKTESPRPEGSQDCAALERMWKEKKDRSTSEDPQPSIERKASTKKQQQKKGDDSTAETAEESSPPPPAAGKENQKKTKNKKTESPRPEGSQDSAKKQKSKKAESPHPEGDAPERSLEQKQSVKKQNQPAKAAPEKTAMIETTSASQKSAKNETKKQSKKAESQSKEGAEEEEPSLERKASTKEQKQKERKEQAKNDKEACPATPTSEYRHDPYGYSVVAPEASEVTEANQADDAAETSALSKKAKKKQKGKERKEAAKQKELAATEAGSEKEPTPPKINDHAKNTSHHVVAKPPTPPPQASTEEVEVEKSVVSLVLDRHAKATSVESPPPSSAVSAVAVVQSAEKNRLAKEAVQKKKEAAAARKAEQNGSAAISNGSDELTRTSSTAGLNGKPKTDDDLAEELRLWLVANLTPVVDSKARASLRDAEGKGTSEVVSCLRDGVLLQILLQRLNKPGLQQRDVKRPKAAGFRDNRQKERTEKQKS